MYPVIRRMLPWLLLALPLTLRAEPIEIRFSHVVAEETPKGQMALKFKQLAEERLQGKVRVTIYPNASLYGDGEVVEQMLAGNVELAAPSLSKFSAYTKALQVFDLPFLFKDMEAVERFQQSRHGRKLLNALELKGIVAHGYLHNGLKQLSATRPLRTPEDAAGLRFRIQNSPVLAAQFEVLGAQPIPKPFSKVYGLLRDKLIDGQENSWSNIYTKRFYEVQPYITESNHGVLDYLVVSPAEFWLGLDRKTRRELKKALDEAIAWGNEIAAKKAAEDRKAVVESGKTTLIELTQEERKAWIEAMRPVWDRFAGEIGPDVIAAAEASN